MKKENINQYSWCNHCWIRSKTRILSWTNYKYGTPWYGKTEYRT